MKLDELRPIPGFEGIYSVTADGRVWSHARFKRGRGESLCMQRGRWLKFDQTQGYLRAPLNSDGRTRFVKVHRLVSEAYLPNPDGKPEINHRDGNKHNNACSNLEWVTRLENIQHAWRIGLYRRRTVVSGSAAHPCGGGRVKSATEEILADNARRAAARFFLRIGQAGSAAPKRDDLSGNLFFVLDYLECEGMLSRDLAWR